MDHEVIVVGAGPAGGSFARELGKKGHEVLIIEEDSEIGKPIQCAGIVSNRTIEKAGVREATLNKVKGAIFYSPNGEKIRVDGGGVKAHIIDRHVFDRKLINESNNYGCNISLNSKALDWNKKELVVKEEDEKKRYRPKLVVGADGVNSCIRRSLSEEVPSSFLPGAQVVLKNVDVEDPDFVELFLGNDFAPGFFAWFIPLGDDVGRLGLCVEQGNNPLHYLKKLMKEHPVVRNKYVGEELEWNFGAVPIGFLGKTYFEKTILVGDAGGFAKPTTGGGVYTSLVAGELGAEAVDLFLEKNVPLSLYQQKWKNEFGSELQKAMALHKMWKNFSDEEINKLINLIKSSNLTEVIERKGDMDYQSHLFYELIKKEPKLIKYGLSFFKNYLRELFL